jgi:hypothetical protein
VKSRDPKEQTTKNIRNFIKSGWRNCFYGEALTSKNNQVYFTLSNMRDIKPKPSEDKIKHLAQAYSRRICSATISATGMKLKEDAKLFFALH